MERVRVGVIGAGAIAPSHCRGVQKHEQAELLAIADTNATRAQAMAKEYSIPRVYTSVEELIANPDIDAVSIGLPTFLHADTALAAIDAGKHVMVDKPFAMNAGEAARVIDAAKKADRVFTVAMNRRFDERAQTIRAIVERGDIGDVYSAETYWCRRAGAPKFGTWFIDKARAGGGALLDIGVHALDLCLSIVGNFRPEKVSGSVWTVFGNRGIGEGGWGKSEAEDTEFTVDDNASAFIKLKGNVTIILKATWVRHQPEPDRMNLELFGSEGGAQVYSPRVCRFGKNRGEYEVVEPQQVKIRYPHCDRMVNWIDAILGNDTLECLPEQSLAVQKIIDAIYESSRSGKEVAL